MKQALNILIGYLTCTDPVIQNKWLNLLSSFWHKDAGWLLKSITQEASGCKITVVDSDGNMVAHTINIPVIPNSQPIAYIQGLETNLSNKIDKVLGKGLSTEDFTTLLKQKLEDLKNYVHPEFHQISEIENLPNLLDGKVDKEAGKQLSTEDFTTPLKRKLEELGSDTYTAPFSPTINTYNPALHKVGQRWFNTVNGSIWECIKHEDNGGSFWFPAHGGLNFKAGLTDGNPLGVNTTSQIEIDLDKVYQNDTMLGIDYLSDLYPPGHLIITKKGKYCLTAKIPLFFNDSGNAREELITAKFARELLNPKPLPNAVQVLEDAYVHDANPTTNYGSSNSLFMKKIGSGFDRTTFLKFDVSTLQNLLPTQKVRLNLHFTSGTGLVNIHYVSDNSWTENGITWDNAPNIGDTFITAEVGAQQNSVSTVNIDITDFLDRVQDDGILSLAIIPTNAGNTFFGLFSKERSFANVATSIQPFNSFDLIEESVDTTYISEGGQDYKILNIKAENILLNSGDVITTRAQRSSTLDNGTVVSALGSFVNIKLVKPILD